MGRDLTTLVTAVADQVVERYMENEDWEKATAVNGLLSTDQDPYVAEARRIVDRAVETQTDEGKFDYDDPKPWLSREDPVRAQCEPATIGQGVLEFYDRTGEERYLEAAHKQYEYLRDDAQRTEDGGIAYSTGPVGLWVDSIYMICPFFARYGDLTGNEAAYDEAAMHIQSQIRHLRDPHTGLFRHEWRETPNTFPESSLWARGNGWALAGMLDTLLLMPENHESYEEIREAFQALAASLIQRQEDNGLWHHILDYRESALETSATLQYSYAFARGADAGLLDDEYADAADRAFEVCRNVVDETGRVRRVAVPPGGPDAPLGDTSYGQGWFLMAADQYQ